MIEIGIAQLNDKQCFSPHIYSMACDVAPLSCFCTAIKIQ